MAFKFEYLSNTKAGQKKSEGYIGMAWSYKIAVSGHIFETKWLSFIDIVFFLIFYLSIHKTREYNHHAIRHPVIEVMDASVMLFHI